MRQEPPRKHRAACGLGLAGSLCHSQPQRLSLCSGVRQVVPTAHRNLTPTLLLVYLPETVASEVCTSACHKQSNPKGHVAPGLLRSECVCSHNGTVSGTGLRGVGFGQDGGQDPPVRTVPLLGERQPPKCAVSPRRCPRSLMSLRHNSEHY